MKLRSVIKLRQSKQDKIPHPGGGGGYSQQVSTLQWGSRSFPLRRGRWHQAVWRSCSSRRLEIQALTIPHPATDESFWFNTCVSAYTGQNENSGNYICLSAISLKLPRLYAPSSLAATSNNCNGTITRMEQQQNKQQVRG